MSRTQQSNIDGGAVTSGSRGLGSSLCGVLVVFLGKVDKPSHCLSPPRSKQVPAHYQGLRLPVT